MKTLKIMLGLITLACATSSCTDQGEDTARRTPIDSTKVHGTAPVTYGGEDPANMQDTARSNTNDTGTKASNTHNSGTYADPKQTPDEKNPW